LAIDPTPFLQARVGTPEDYTESKQNSQFMIYRRGNKVVMSITLSEEETIYYEVNPYELRDAITRVMGDDKYDVDQTGET